jgi:hypothetical protein
MRTEDFTHKTPTSTRAFSVTEFGELYFLMVPTTISKIILMPGPSPFLASVSFQANLQATWSLRVSVGLLWCSATSGLDFLPPTPPYSLLAPLNSGLLQLDDAS